MAFWLGTLTALVGLSGFFTYSSNFWISVVIVVFYDILFVVVFAYLDSLVKVARRSDPLLRNIIHWEKTRYIGWAGVALIFVFNALSLSPSAGLANLSGELVTILISVPFIIGGAGVLVGATRIKDPMLRGNLKWLGLALLVSIVEDILFLLESLAGLSNYEIYYSYWGLISFVITMVVAYCLYRAARSLAPISHFPMDEEKQNPTVP